MAPIVPTWVVSDIVALECCLLALLTFSARSQGNRRAVGFKYVGAAFQPGKLMLHAYICKTWFFVYYLAFGMYTLTRALSRHFAESLDHRTIISESFHVVELCSIQLAAFGLGIVSLWITFARKYAAIISIFLALFAVLASAAALLLSGLVAIGFFVLQALTLFVISWIILFNSCSLGPLLSIVGLGVIIGGFVVDFLRFEPVPQIIKLDAVFLAACGLGNLIFFFFSRWVYTASGISMLFPSEYAEAVS
mmetsp:Transcript_2861/g.5095  ORF Transcript_2861/g.5095 Transcript_2861/m.5095 type:complete len:250 (+) Transcript_2861:17-766(+)